MDLVFCGFGDLSIRESVALLTMELWIHRSGDLWIYGSVNSSAISRACEVSQEFPWLHLPLPLPRVPVQLPVLD